MRYLLHFLLLPGLSFSGQISGTVSDLSGKPVSGAVVASTVESDVSKPSGSWILGRTSGRAQRVAPTSRITSNLVLVNGHPRIEWRGHGFDGRTRPEKSNSVLAELAGRAAAVESVVPETVTVYWKGKRLVQLPLSTDDTAGVAIQIDTAWSGDYGIPWNPKIKYGSLRDDRDGHVYRTVKIGAQTWMAENLNFSGEVQRKESIYFPLDTIIFSAGKCYDPDTSYCNKYGRSYNMYEALDVVDNLGKQPVRGICPEGWRVPGLGDLRALFRAVDVDTSRMHDWWSHQGGSKVAGLRLGAAAGWIDPVQPDDRAGFRLLGTGIPWNITGTVCPLIDTCLSGPGPWLTYAGELARFWLADNPGVVGPGCPMPVLIVEVKKTADGLFTTTDAYWDQSIGDTDPFLDENASVRCVLGGL